MYKWKPYKKTKVCKAVRKALAILPPIPMLVDYNSAPGCCWVQIVCIVVAQLLSGYILKLKVRQLLAVKSSVL